MIGLHSWKDNETRDCPSMTDMRVSDFVLPDKNSQVYIGWFNFSHIITKSVIEFCPLTKNAGQIHSTVSNRPTRQLKNLTADFQYVLERALKLKCVFDLSLN